MFNINLILRVTELKLIIWAIYGLYARTRFCQFEFLQYGHRKKRNHRDILMCQFSFTLHVAYLHDVDM